MIYQLQSMIKISSESWLNIYQVKYLGCKSTQRLKAKNYELYSK